MSRFVKHHWGLSCFEMLRYVINLNMNSLRFDLDTVARILGGFRAGLKSRATITPPPEV